MIVVNLLHNLIRQHIFLFYKIVYIWSRYFPSTMWLKLSRFMKTTGLSGTPGTSI